MEIPNPITIEFLQKIRLLDTDLRLHSRWSRIKGINDVLKVLCKEYPFVDTSNGLSELVYCVKNNVKERPTCKTCEQRVIFEPRTKSYNSYCSRKCYFIDSKNVQKGREATMLLRYGANNPGLIPEFVAKRDKTLKRRYGVDSPLQSPTIWKRFTKTCLKRYGTKHPLQNAEIKNKVRQTVISRYGVDYWKELFQKGREAIYEKYGHNRLGEIKQKPSKENWELPDVFKDNDI